MNNYSTGLPLTGNVQKPPLDNLNILPLYYIQVCHKHINKVVEKKRKTKTKTNHRQKVVDMPHSTLYVKKVINTNDFVKERNKVVLI